VSEAQSGWLAAQSVGRVRGERGRAGLVGRTIGSRSWSITLGDE
jgi:hypothetical protein